GCEAGRSAPDDDDILRVSGSYDLGDVVRPWRSLRLSGDMDETVPLLRVPACDGIDSRCAESFSRPEAEAGVMQGAADRFTSDEPLGERAAVVGAEAVHCENLAAGA